MTIKGLGIWLVHDFASADHFIGLGIEAVVVY